MTRSHRTTPCSILVPGDCTAQTLPLNRTVPPVSLARPSPLSPPPVGACLTAAPCTLQTHPPSRSSVCRARGPAHACALLQRQHATHTAPNFPLTPSAVFCTPLFLLSPASTPWLTAPGAPCVMRSSDQKKPRGGEWILCRRREHAAAWGAAQLALIRRWVPCMGASVCAAV